MTSARPDPPPGRARGRGLDLLGGILLGAGLVLLALWLAPEPGAGSTQSEATSARAIEEGPASVKLSPGAPASEDSARESALDDVGAILVRVVARPDGAAVADATIQIEGASTPSVIAKTDVKGTARMVLPKDVETGIRIARDGYIPKTLRSNALTYVSPREAWIELDRAGEIQISVRRTSGEPVAGALAQPHSEPFKEVAPPEWPIFVPAGATHLLSRPDAQVGETDAAGRVTLRRLPCAVPVWVRVSGDFLAQKLPVTIDPAIGRAQLEFTVEPAASVRGRVVDAQGVPLPRVAVRLTMLGVGTPAVRPLEITQTDLEGCYQFTGLPRASARINAVVPESTAIHVELDATEKELPDIVCDAGRDVEGRLVSRHGLLDTKRLYTALVKDGRRFEGGDSPFNGAFHFKANVPRGDFIVEYVTYYRRTVRRIGVIPVELPLKNARISVDDWMGALEVAGNERIGGGTSTLRLALAVEAGGTGDVDFEDPEVLRGELDFRTGRAAVGGIPSGVYTVVAEVTNRGVQVFRGVALKPGEVTRLELDTFGQGALRVVCTAADGEPVRARVQTTSAAGGVRECMTSAEGEAVLDELPAGPWSLTATEIGGSNRRTPRRAEPYPVRVKAGERVEASLRLLPPPRIRGLVRAADGAPAVGVRMALQRRGRGHVEDRFTGADGRFEYAEVDPGDYWLTWIEVPRVGGAKLGGSQEVKVEAGADLFVEMSQHDLPWRARFVQNGVPIAGLTNIKLLEPGFRGLRTGRPGTDGELELPRPRGAAALVVGHRGQIDPTVWHERRDYFAWVDLTRGSLPSVLEAATGEVTVAIAAGDDGYERPTLNVLSVRGIELYPMPAENFPYVDGTDGRRFQNVPPDAELELVGRNHATGAPHVKRLTFPGGTMQASWP